jgi:hypothetical protein
MLFLFYYSTVIYADALYRGIINWSYPAQQISGSGSHFFVFASPLFF